MAARRALLEPQIDINMKINIKSNREYVCVRAYVGVHVCVRSMYLRICVCDCVRERERESVCVCMCIFVCAMYL